MLTRKGCLKNGTVQKGTNHTGIELALMSMAAIGICANSHGYTHSYPCQCECSL